MPAIEIAVGLGQCRGGHVPSDNGGAEQVAVGRGKVGPDFQGPAVAGEGFIELPLVRPGVAQVVVHSGKIRPPLQGPAVAGDRRVQLPGSGN